MAGMKKTIGYAVGAFIIVYALIKKLTLPCYGCQKESFWFRCLGGTGAGSQSCEAYKAAESRIDFAGDIMGKAGEYMENAYDFTREELPAIVTEFIATLKDQVLGLARKMGEQVTLMITFLREKIALFLAKAKDIATSSYDRYLKKVIDSMISFVTNNLISPIWTVINKIVEFRALVWQKLSEAVQKFADLNIGAFVGRVVDVFKSIPAAIEGVKIKIVNMVNNVKNDVVGKLNQGINQSAELVESVVDKVSDLSDTIVDGSEGIVNKVILKINQSMNGVEGLVDTITGKLEQGINVIKPIINTAGDAINGARKMNIRGIGKPLHFLPHVDPFNGVDIPDLEIPDIKDLDFPDIDFSIDIPTVNIPAPPDINPDNIVFPEIPGMGFISDKIESVKTSIANIFERAMDPLYTAVAGITLLLGNVVSSVNVFYDKFLSWESIKERSVLIVKQAKNGLEALKNFVVDEILPAFIALLKHSWTHIFTFVKKMAEVSWVFVKKAGKLLGKMFNEVYKVVVKVTGAVAKGVMGTTLYVLGSTVDKYTGFIPISLTLKMLSIALVVIWMFTGQFVKNGMDFVYLAYGGIHAGLTVLSDADAFVDTSVVKAFPSISL